MTRNQDKKVVGSISLSSPFFEYGTVNPLVDLKINLSDLIDGYDYHDFPPFVDIYLYESHLEILIKELKESLKKLKALKRSKHA